MKLELLARGAPVGPMQDVGGGARYAGIEDPDGNTLTLQEMSWRTGDAFEERAGHVGEHLDEGYDDGPSAGRL